MCKISLPINENPPIKCYVYDFQPLSIILSENYDIRYQWLFNHYYTFKISSDNYLTFSNDWWFRRDNIFLTGNYIKLPVKSVDSDAILKIVLNMMKQGFYCVGNFKDNIHSNIFHNFILYEFDSQTNNLRYLSYLGNKNIKQINIDFNKIFDAINSSNELDFILLFTKLNKNYKFNSFNINIFKSEVNKYIDINEKNFGINAIHKFIHYLYSYNSTDKLIDIKRNLLILYEHKNLMFERLNFMYKEKVFSDYSSINVYERIVSKYEKLLEAYREFKDEKNFDKIKLLAITIEEITKLEITALNNILDNCVFK